LKFELRLGRTIVATLVVLFAGTASSSTQVAQTQRFPQFENAHVKV